MSRLKCFVCKGRFALLTRARPDSPAHDFYKVAGAWLCGLCAVLVRSETPMREERFWRRKASPPRARAAGDEVAATE